MRCAHDLFGIPSLQQPFFSTPLQPINYRVKRAGLILNGTVRIYMIYIGFKPSDGIPLWANYFMVRT
jgi:hypothetical protein